MDEKLRQLEKRIEELEADKLAVTMSYNSDTNLFRSWSRSVMSPTVNVSIGTSDTPACAILNLSTTTAGLLVPRMTTTQRNAIASPSAGLVIYNTTTNKLNVRVAAAWEAVTSA